MDGEYFFFIFVIKYYFLLDKPSDMSDIYGPNRYIDHAENHSLIIRSTSLLFEFQNAGNQDYIATRNQNESSKSTTRNFNQF